MYCIVLYLCIFIHYFMVARKLFRSFIPCFVGANNDTATKEKKQCNCVNQCKMVTYSSTLSTAQLTNTRILNEIRNDADLHVSRQFWNALEVAQRVDESRMLQTVQQVEAVLDAHSRLTAMVQYHAVTESTSVTTRLMMLSNALFDLLLKSVESSRGLHAQMESVYENYVDYLVTDVVSAIQKAEILYAQVTASYIEDETDSDQQLLLVSQLESVGNKIAQFETHLDATSAYASQFFPKRLLLSTACRDAKKELNRTIFNQANWIAEFPPRARFISASSMRKMSNLRSLLSRTAYCVQEYKFELDGFLDWLDSIRLPKFVSSSMSTSWSDAVKIDGRQLLDILRRFVGGSLTKSELAKWFLKLHKDMEVHADNLDADVQQSVFSRLDWNVDKLKDMLDSFFLRLFATYVKLQKYMDSNDKGIENSAREQPIWRKPAASFQSSNVRVALSLVWSSVREYVFYVFFRFQKT